MLQANVATAQDQQLSPDEQYIHIMSVIDRADALRKAGQTDAAHAKYVEAEKALLIFKSNNPLFAPKTVAYRLKEVTDQAEVRPVISETNSAKPKSNLEAEAAPAPKNNVKLVEAGAEPKSVLRYKVNAGDKLTAILTTKVKLDMPQGMAGQNGAPAQVPNIPAISIPMDITVQSVAPNGDITFQTVMGEAALAQDTNTPPEMAQAMQAALTGVKGVTGTTVVSNRGITKKSDMKAPPNSNPQARQFIDQIKEAATGLNVELPEEAVGVGAKWEVKEPAKGQTPEQTTSVELVSLEGDKLTAKISAEAAGKAAAAGAVVNASGTVKVDLSKPIASSADLNLHTETPVGRDKSVVMKMDINISVEAQ